MKLIHRTPLALAAFAALALTIGPATAAPISIDFDSNNAVQSGEPTHSVGMTLPGQVGSWYKLSTGGSPGSPTITTTEGPTFTFNTTGVAYRAYAPAGTKLLREDFFWLTDGYGPITWELTGLTPNGIYDIILYGRYSPAYGGYRGADMSIAGYNDGAIVPQETTGTNEEGDWDAPGVVADENGKITGTFAWGSQSHAEFAAIQFEQVGVGGPTTDYTDGIPDGDNVGYVYLDDSEALPGPFGLSQVLGETFAEDTDYEVTVQVGRSDNLDWPGFRVELRAGADLLGFDEDPTTTAPTAGNFITSTVTYTYDAGDAGLVGQDLEVRLLSRGQDPESGSLGEWAVDFDNVTFTVTGP